jgi:hypothetical protein
MNNTGIPAAMVIQLSFRFFVVPKMENGRRKRFKLRRFALERDQVPLKHSGWMMARFDLAQKANFYRLIANTR